MPSGWFEHLLDVADASHGLAHQIVAGVAHVDAEDVGAGAGQLLDDLLGPGGGAEGGDDLYAAQCVSWCGRVLSRLVGVGRRRRSGRHRDSALPPVSVRRGVGARAGWRLVGRAVGVGAVAGVGAVVVSLAAGSVNCNVQSVLFCVSTSKKPVRS